MSTANILIVDDDSDDRMIIKDAMEELDAVDKICFAEDGEQALKQLERFFNNGHTPALVVLDLNMPKMNGTHTLTKLKDDARFKDIHVIIYSTSINILEKEKCMKLGAESYITKPVTYVESIRTAQFFLKVSEEVGS